MLCNLQTISDIHEWSKAEPVREFHIRKLPSRAQFYNIIALVDPEKFNMIFIKWVQTLLNDGSNGKTIAIDGKTICSTDKLTKDGNPLYIVSAIISESELVLGSMEC